ncbi:MAG: tRNA dihydrouridine synthase DusB, partial [Patescibacteria group bacterium]
QPEKFLAALEHSEKFVELLPRAHFLTIRKHLAWYSKGFDNAAQVRGQLTRVNTIEEIREIIKTLT